MGLSDSELRQWATGRSLAGIIASDLAAAINKGLLNKWNDLPGSAGLADDYGTSTRTVSRAKQMLADHGLLVMAGGRYYVA